MKIGIIMRTTVALCVGMLLASCAKEGKIDHRKRIDNIVANEFMYQDGVAIYTTGEYVSELWHWAGKEMYRIDFVDKRPYSENFFYDNRNRLLRTTVPAYGIRSEFYYDGKELNRIEYYINDELGSTMTFVRGENNIVGIVCQYYIADTASVETTLSLCNPLTAMLGRRVARMVSDRQEAMLARIVQKSGSKQHVSVSYDLSWSDENLTNVRCSTPEGKYDISMAYDDKHNPYRQLFAYHETSDQLGGFAMMSENNIVSISMPYGLFDNIMFSYSYEYDDDYPVKRTLTYSYPTVDHATFDSVIVKCETTERFTYKD